MLLLGFLNNLLFKGCGQFGHGGSLNFSGFHSSFFLVVLLEDFPSGRGHESLRLFSTFGTELSHFGSRDKFEVLSVLGLRVEEFHLGGFSVKSSKFERKDLNSVKESLAVL